MTYQPEFPPTPEQEIALDLFLSGKNLAIEAGAGTGKTSTLLLLANSTAKNGQYLAFNKAIVVDATAKMPGNVACSTAHSLAYRSVGKRYAARLQSSKRMRSDEIARILGVNPIVLQVDDHRKVLSSGYLASLVMRAVTVFCQTADEAPSHRHVPYIDGIDIPALDGRRTYDNNNIVAQALAPFVTKAWADVNNVTGALPYKHEHYLKSWQLNDPYIHADFIMFDECQDANPVMLAIVEAQTHAQLVFVGDSQQAIYGFTGAVNALGRIREMGGEVAFLTQSFRFGPAVADVANHLLAGLGAELKLIGTPELPSVVTEVDTPDCILTRTNAAAVHAVLGAQQDGRKVHLVGGGKEIVSFAKAAAMLMGGRKVDHPELACFDSWGEVRDYVDHDEQGGDLRLMVRLVDEFGVDLILTALDNMVTEAAADLIVSTAHKSKGREWNRVKLAGDFPVEKAGVDEMRLLYVAVTRAKLELDIVQVGLLADYQADSVEAGPVVWSKVGPRQVGTQDGQPVAYVTIADREGGRQYAYGLHGQPPIGACDTEAEALNSATVAVEGVLA